MGRRARFRPRIAGAHELSLWTAAEKLYGDIANKMTRGRVVREFSAFLAMNGCDAVHGLKLWVGAALQDGLAWGTIDSYSAYLNRVVWPSLSYSDRIEWRATRAVIKSAHADADTGGAPCCTPDQLARILESVSLRIRQAIAAIAFTGARMADVRRWRRKQVVFSPRMIKVEVRLTKNRRRRAQRRILRLNNVHRVIGFLVDPSLTSLSSEDGTPEDRPFAVTKVSEVNAALGVLCKKHGWTRLTTYSFRKFFIKRVSQYMKFDWPRIIQWTLHTGIDVVAAHYDCLHASDDDDDEAQ